jgi:hypothetical protein
VTELIAFLREYFQASTFELVVLFGLVILLGVGTSLAIAFRDNEQLVKRERELKLLGGFLLDLVVSIESRESVLDLEPYNKRAEERVEDGLEHIDPRMLYLMDKADDYVSSRSGFNVSFDELLAKAEHIFQLYKNSEVQ